MQNPSNPHAATTSPISIGEMEKKRKKEMYSRLLELQNENKDTVQHQDSMEGIVVYYCVTKSCYKSILCIIKISIL